MKLFQAKLINHTLNVLLLYLVKCTICYYCTVNSMFHAVPNNQHTSSVHRYFEHTTDRNVIELLAIIEWHTHLYTCMHVNR